MNTKLIKKCGSLAISTLMAVSLFSASAFAAAIGNGVANSSDTTITIPKGVTFINDSSFTSYGPGITYSYTVAPATVAAGTTVKDAQGHETTVNAGPAAGISLDSSTLTFGSNETFTTSPSGTESTKNISLSVDPTAFSKPGVYRYVITDTTSTADLYAAGITRDDNYQEERYIDVFIKRNASNQFEVAGYALKTTNDSTDGTATPPTPKDPGYVADSDVEDGDPADTDRYETYNISVNKEVTGAMGDVEHEFPFAITISNQGKSYYAHKQGTASTVTSATSLSTTLKHGQTYFINALSPKATVTVVETNDTTDLYSVSVRDLTGGNDITVTENASAKTYTIGAGAVSTYDADNSATSVNELGDDTDYNDMLYTNNLDEVSPTGLVMRYGAYMFMIGAAILLLIASKRQSKEEM